MVLKVIYGCLGVALGMVGLLMTVVPATWKTTMMSMLKDPGPRFLATQGMVLGGLILFMGTTGFHGFWVWVILGVVGVVIACFLLGCSAKARETLIHAIEQWPPWLYRLSGVMLVTLAILFGADVILHGS